MLLVKACYEITFKNVLNICSYVLAISIKIVLFYLQQEDEGSDTAGQAGDAAEREGDSDSNSDEANSGDESGDEKPLEKAVSTVDEEEEEAEWERFQKRINK